MLVCKGYMRKSNMMPYIYCSLCPFLHFSCLPFSSRRRSLPRTLLTWAAGGMASSWSTCCSVPTCFHPAQVLSGGLSVCLTS